MCHPDPSTRHRRASLRTARLRRLSTLQPWLADIDVSDELAAQLIGRQFPALAPTTVTRIGAGWDNVAFTVNGAFVFRFPRRAVSAKLIETEYRVLPLIEQDLPLAISAPSLVGKPSQDYPWQFAGYRKLAGRALSALRPEAAGYTRLARTLGNFLRSLHATDCKPLLAAGLPNDEIGRFDYIRTIGKLSERLQYLQVNHVVGDAATILAFAQSLAPIAPRPQCRTVVHGDLYSRHILVDADLQPTGIIDWGDVHFGEPAIDLTVAYGVIPPNAREIFFAAYGTVDEATRRLARYRAIYSSAVVAHYGHHIGDGDLLDLGLRGLRLARM
jgi:aminoglycoside phosphotransferase (APT) family kinase protein